MQALLVEPSRFLRSVIGSIFAKHNIDVEMADNGQQGLAALAKRHCDLLCFALELGDMRGTEFFREAQQRHAVGFATTLMVTSNRDKTVFDEALRAGVTHCFLKTDLKNFEAYIEQWEQSASRRLSGRVLLVEDSDTAAKFYAEVMIGLGLEVVRFKNAEEAITSFLNEDYQIVVTDFVLEGLQTGLSLIRNVRSQKGKKGGVPIVAFSAIDNAARRVDILRAGANDFVNKPVIAEELAARLGNLLMLRELWNRLEAQHQLLKEMALRDRLTSLHNRHHLDAEMPGWMTEAQSRQRPLSLIVIDIDHFKHINDQYGHAHGDEVLITVADLLRSVFEAPQQIIRHGGEEFLLVLPGTPTSEAALLAERLRQRIAQDTIAGIPLTVSLGVASFVDGDTFDRLFSRADAALYEAKRRGRNRVVTS